jgi:purine-binding chemotaxis protein CheW
MATMPVNTRDAGPPASLRERNQFLAFSLRGETFAIDIRSIREVIQYGEITEVPLMPATIRGVINLRGAVVPVIDLAVRFGGAPTELSRRTCVVILELEREEGRASMGVMVDHVSEVMEMAMDEIEPAPAFGSRLRAEFIQGIGKVAGRFVILLEVKHVLAVEELSALGG